MRTQRCSTRHFPFWCPRWGWYHRCHLNFAAPVVSIAAGWGSRNVLPYGTRIPRKSTAAAIVTKIVAEAVAVVAKMAKACTMATSSRLISVQILLLSYIKLCRREGDLCCCPSWAEKVTIPSHCLSPYFTVQLDGSAVFARCRRAPRSVRVVRDPTLAQGKGSGFPAHSLSDDRVRTLRRNKRSLATDQSCSTSSFHMPAMRNASFMSSSST